MGRKDGMCQNKFALWPVPKNANCLFEKAAEMSYRFEDQGPTIPARFQTIPPEVREAFDMERAKVTFWRGLTIAACVLGIVGILL